jgi:hypothetical protein
MAAWKWHVLWRRHKRAVISVFVLFSAWHGLSGRTSRGVRRMNIVLTSLDTAFRAAATEHTAVGSEAVSCRSATALVTIICVLFCAAPQVVRVLL